MFPNPLRILLTGVGAPGTSGTMHMLRKGAETSQVSLNIFGTESRSGFMAPSSIDQVFQVARPNDPKYLHELNSIIEAESIDLVIPQTTHESAFLSRHKSDVACNVAVIQDKEFEMLNNKGLLTEAFVAANLPAPRMHWVRTYSEFLTALEKLNYPINDVVLKLPSSSGMRGVRRVSESQETLEEFTNNKPDGWSVTKNNLVSILGLETWPNMIATQYLLGPEYSVDVWRRNGMTVVLPRIRSQIRSGISMETDLELNESITNIVDEFLKHYDIEGLLGFQFILDSGTPQILECNPRVQGTMVASLLSGVNILWLEVKWQLGIPISKSERKLTSKIGHFKRTWAGELVYSNGDIEPI